MRAVWSLTLATVVQVTAAAAQNPIPFPPDARYDAAIPSPRAFLGHDPADVVTPPEDIVRYMRALAEAASDRARLLEYGQTHEGRPLVMLAIGAPERMARVDVIQADLARLADPRGLSTADEARLVAGLPVVTVLAHSIHGNEISGAGAAIAAAYHLLAAQGDADVQTILRESIVVIDPIQNPDGRARFVFQNRLHRAATPDPDPVAAERDEPWPGGRTNHYLFDLNRDWYAHTQPESRGRIRALLAWNPHVVVDLHEMGANSTYYFPPAAMPGNPFATETQKELFEVIGRENADAFDSRGWPYFIREIYDAFYPGYGASWPTTHGALGHTFEMASARGLEVERYDGSILTYGDGIARQFVAGQRTALTAARNRERILRAFVDFRRSAVRDGERGTRAYVLHSDRDPALALRLARTLAQNGVEVYRSGSAVNAGGRTLPVGSYVVPLAQPAGRLVRNLLDRQVDMDSAFVRRQRERRARRLSDEIYDITAWNLPLLWNVDAIPVTGALPARGGMVAGDPFAPVFAALPRVPAAIAPERNGDAALGAAAAAAVDASAPVNMRTARVGYVIPWNTAAAAALVELQAAGIRVHAAGAPVRLQGRRFDVGTLFIRNADLDATSGTRDSLARIAGRHGVEVIPVDNAFVDEGGISLGSNQMRALPAKRVVLLWDEPASSQSAGWARWVLEQRYGQRTTAVRVRSFARLELDDVGVIIMPEGNYVGAIDVARLRRWIQDGGTLITMGESTRWATRDDVELLATRAELRAGSRADTAAERRPPAAASQPIEYLDAIAPAREAPEPVPGALVNVRADTSHVLAAGTGGALAAMVNSSRIFSPLTLDRGTNVARYAEVDNLLASGIIWEDTRPQLASKAYLMHQPLGRGRVIAFAEDPNFRGYAEGTMLLFMNAVLLAPGF